jgi:hypothetical protein
MGWAHIGCEPQEIQVDCGGKLAGSSELSLHSLDGPAVDPQVENFNNADHVCDLHDHCSMTLMVYLYNGNAFNWYIKKQAKIPCHLTSAKLCPLSRCQL